VSTGSRVLAVVGWVAVAVLTVAVARCVRLHSAEPPRKPLGDVDLRESVATEDERCPRVGLQFVIWRGPDGVMHCDHAAQGEYLRTWWGSALNR
jgi:hypothetical protein